VVVAGGRVRSNGSGSVEVVRRIIGLGDSGGSESSSDRGAAVRQ
jgi:hypothetical protein